MEILKRQKVLFINNMNGHELRNPIATLVEVFDTSIEIMEILEKNQRGVWHFGASWKDIMEDGMIKHNIIKAGRLSEFDKSEYDTEYTLISGTY